jgi:hypothetical protein
VRQRTEFCGDTRSVLPFESGLVYRRRIRMWLIATNNRSRRTNARRVTDSGNLAAQCPRGHLTSDVGRILFGRKSVEVP